RTGRDRIFAAAAGEGPSQGGRIGSDCESLITLDRLPGRSAVTRWQALAAQTEAPISMGACLLWAHAVPVGLVVTLKRHEGRQKVRRPPRAGAPTDFPGRGRRPAASPRALGPP